MNAERWAQVCAALECALEASGAERARYLEALERRDPELSREVRELIEEAPRAERIRTLGALEEAQPAPSAAGELVGDWRLKRLIGRGGMGEVWVGERTRGGFEQRAAIKLLTARRPSAETRERFRRERALLAALEHPHIARLIDGGETGGGDPYLAMELIDGQPIDRWCAEQREGLRERIELVVQVAAALQFAHQRLTVHRDIKPANILVTPQRTAKLLDFGVAKLLTPEDPGWTSANFMTPRYASPEQAQGQAVTTGSDVYSLGVVLYELLTGRDPYGLSSTALLAVAKAVATTEPRRASTVIDAHAPLAEREGGSRRLARLLRGDLDTILAKALAKDPARRYPTASEFGLDLRRYLDGQPVSARPDTFRYRAQKLVQRNKLAAAALAAFSAVLVIGVTASWVTTLRALRAEELAQKRFAQVRELASTLVFGVHDRVSRLGGSTEVRQYLLDTTRHYLDDLAAEGELSPELAGEIAGTYLRLAEVQGGHGRGGTGDIQAALTSAERALELLRTSCAGLPEAELRLADAHALLGDLERYAGSEEAAARHYEELERGSRARWERDGGDPRAARDLSRALAQQGRLSSLSGDCRRSLELTREARELLRPHGQSAEMARDLMVLSIRIGEDLISLGQVPEAIEELEQAAAAAGAARELAPHDAQLALDQGRALCTLGRALAARRDWSGARASLQGALAILRPEHGADRSNLVVAEALSMALEALGNWHRTHAEPEVALALYREASTVMDGFLEQGEGDRYARRGVAQLAALEGLVEQELGRPDAARARFELSLELTEPDLAETGAGEIESATEIRVTARIGLIDLALAAGERERAGAALESMWAEVDPLVGRFPDVAWPGRKRGLVAFRLATWLEESAHQGERREDERRADLVRARELFALGAEDGRRLAAKGWLLESEQSAVELFETDVRRCDEALAALGGQAGP